MYNYSMAINELFTIGQFAKIHGINKKTLMWYDEIDLFKPMIIKDNGYRYYSYQQSHLLETILMYKDLGLSLNEIKDILNETDLDKIKEFSDIKLNELKDKINHLNNVYNHLKEYNKGIDTIKNIDVNDIDIVYRKSNYLALTNFEEGSSYENEISNVIDKLKEYHIKHFRDVSFGSMLSVNKIYKKDYINYDYLYFELRQNYKSAYIKKEGNYLRGYHVGDWSLISNAYDRMLEYASNNKIKLKGYAYEKGVNEAFIDEIEDYITMIEIEIDE